MRFTCEHATLIAALATPARAISPSSMLSRPSLAGLHFELDNDNLRITGSNLDTTLSVECSVEGHENGVALAPSRLLLEIVKALPGDTVEFSTDKSQGTLKAEAANFQIQLITPEDYPVAILDQLRVSDNDYGDSTRLDSGEFRGAVAQVVPSASTDQSRPILTGVLMSSTDTGLRVVSTDSYRLALRDLGGALPIEQDVLVPAAALREVQRWSDTSDGVEVRFAEQYAMFKSGWATMVTRLIPGEYPAYESLLPSDLPNRLTVDRQLFQSVIKRIALITDKGQSSIKLSLSSDSETSLTVSAWTMDVGEASETIPASYEGDDLEISFNHNYLGDAANAITADEMLIEITDNLKPVLISPVDDDSFTYLLMPFRT